MTHLQLKQSFEAAGTSASGFIKWAAAHGVKVHHATVSRHLAGTQGVTAPWELVYKWYFSSLQNKGQ